jgi:hypothetical protein
VDDDGTRLAWPLHEPTEPPVGEARQGTEQRPCTRAGRRERRARFGRDGPSGHAQGRVRSLDPSCARVERGLSAVLGPPAPAGLPCDVPAVKAREVARFRARTGPRSGLLQTGQHCWACASVPTRRLARCLASCYWFATQLGTTGKTGDYGVDWESDVSCPYGPEHTG